MLLMTPLGPSILFPKFMRPPCNFFVRDFLTHRLLFRRGILLALLRATLPRVALLPLAGPLLTQGGTRTLLTLHRLLPSFRTLALPLRRFLLPPS
jgi:hypothetical protein